MKSAELKEQNYQFKQKFNMKTKTSILALTKAFFILFVMCCLFSCGNEPKCYTYKKVLSVAPHHATRIFVTYISQCGDTITSTEHCSATIKADNITFDAQDYLDGKLKYGAVK